MAKQIEQALRAHVDAFVADMSELIRAEALATVYEALGNGAAPARTATRPARKKAASKAAASKPTARKKSARKSGGRIRRSSEELEALGEAFLAHVKANPGLRLEEIAPALGEPTSALTRPVSLLIAAKRLRTEGQKRGTRYFAGAGGARKKSAKRAKRKSAKKSSKKKTTKRAA